MSINFSNFISNFTDLSNIDIVSSVSAEVTLKAIVTGTPSITIDVSGRYFCIGNLLIQFNSGTISNQTETSYTMPFPYTYESNPYTVILTPTNTSGNRVNVTLESFNTSSFVFEISNNKGWANFIAIGPRPSALYPLP